MEAAVSEFCFKAQRWLKWHDDMTRCRCPKGNHLIQQIVKHYLSPIINNNAINWGKTLIERTTIKTAGYRRQFYKSVMSLAFEQRVIDREKQNSVRNSRFFRPPNDGDHWRSTTNQKYCSSYRLVFLSGIRKKMGARPKFSDIFLLAENFKNIFFSHRINQLPN